MTSCFDLLGLPPQAALEELALEAAYHEASRKAHPDQQGGDADLSAALNTAAEVLRSPASRLKHLLELNGKNAWRAVPLEPHMMDLFGRLGTMLGNADTLAAKVKGASSALAKALLAAEVLTAREGLEQLHEELAEQLLEAEAGLTALDSRIHAGDENAWHDIHTCQAKLAYLEKWRGQLRQRLMQLML